MTLSIGDLLTRDPEAQREEIRAIPPAAFRAR
ncbi:hypothetical protein ACOJBO_13730 [Rhizobium beringeri]